MAGPILTETYKLPRRWELHKYLILSLRRLQGDAYCMDNFLELCERLLLLMGYSTLRIGLLIIHRLIIRAKEPAGPCVRA